MSIKPSNIFGSDSGDVNLVGTEALSFLDGMGVNHLKERLENDLDKIEYSLSDYILEEKDPEDMFMEPVHIDQCPLCGGNVYSENDPSNDHTMARKCCKCTWNDNQFMTWEEMN